MRSSKSDLAWHLTRLYLDERYSFVQATNTKNHAHLIQNTTNLTNIPTIPPASTSIKSRHPLNMNNFTCFLMYLKNFMT